MTRELSRRPDIHAVMVTPHWGIEYQHKPERKQVEWGKDIAEAGATAIIGQHPHVMQPFDKITTSDGREVAIAYSLGNFVSGQIGPATQVDRDPAAWADADRQSKARGRGARLDSDLDGGTRLLRGTDRART